MQQNIEIFNSIDFFSKIQPQAVKLFAFLCKRVVLEKGDILFSEGDDHGICPYIISGSFRIFSSHDQHSFTSQKGEFYGSLALFCKAPSLFTMQATEKSELLLITRDIFNDVCEQFPALYKITVENCIQNVYQWERQNVLGTNPLHLGVSLI